MSRHSHVSPDALNGLVEFDCPFTIAESVSGALYLDTDTPNVYAPSVYDGDIDSTSWEFASAGYSGQYSYRGPVMHASELLSGRLASDILDTPGTYVVVACEVSCDDHDSLMCDECDPFPEGWAVLRLAE